MARAEQRDLGLDIGQLFAAVFEVDLTWMSTFASKFGVLRVRV
jgi:hypothetical protein